MCADSLCETGISFLFQCYMLVFVNLYMYIFVVREGLMEDKLLQNSSPSSNNKLLLFYFIKKKNTLLHCLKRYFSLSIKV